MFVDTHCHIHDPRFDEDREQVIERARKSGVDTMISVGCDMETIKRAQSLAQIHADIYFTAGCHPHEAQLADKDLVESLRTFAKDPKCVGIGECGLDYYYNHSPRDTQQSVFAQQAELAKEIGKPLIVHVRDAYDDCLALLKDRDGANPVVIHCFTGTLDIAKRMLERGYFISISGVVTFKNPGELDQVVRYVPLERLIVETDSPYLAPIPFRGKRNEPAYVVKVAERVAELKGLSLQDAAPVLKQNSKNIFKV